MLLELVADVGLCVLQHNSVLDRIRDLAANSKYQ